MSLIETKAEFARRLGKHRSAVAHWITDGKLTTEPGGGLVEHNGKQQIDVAVATARLQVSLDLGQRLGNGAETQSLLAGLDEPAAPVEDESDSAPLKAARVPDPEISRYNLARAVKAENEAAMGRLALQRETGRWVDREEVAAATARESQELIVQIQTIVEQSLPAAVAEALGTEVGPTLIAIRDAYRAEMKRLSERLSLEAKSLEPDHQPEDEYAA